MLRPFCRPGGQSRAGTADKPDAGTVRPPSDVPTANSLSATLEPLRLNSGYGRGAGYGETDAATGSRDSVLEGAFSLACGQAAAPASSPRPPQHRPFEYATWTIRGPRVYVRGVVEGRSRSAPRSI